MNTKTRREAQDWLETVGALIPDGLAIADREGRLIWTSPRFTAMFPEGECRDAVLAKVASVSAVVAQAMSGDMTLPDGRELEWGAAPLARDEALAWNFSDATERRKTAHALLEAQGRLRLLSAHTRGIIFELDSEARFVGVWASDPSLLARPEHELLGRTLVEVLGPELGAWHDEKVRKVLRTGIGEEYEYPLDVASGRRMFAAANVAVPSRDGKGRAAIFWIRDITEEVAMRTKLLQSERLASVGMLAAGVAHEINNPLGYMLLNLGRLRSSMQALAGKVRDSALDEARNAIEMISQGAERVRKIVGDLRIFSRDDEAVGPVDVRNTLEFCLNMVQTEIEGRASIIKDFGEVPIIIANEGRLSQVYINLILNAVQAIGSKPPDESYVRLVTRTDESGRAVVEVRDTGKGVPRAHLDRLFDPFFTTKENGIGLGLPICLNIVRSMGGDIEVESEEQRGATFRVLLPREAAPRSRSR